MFTNQTQNPNTPALETKNRLEREEQVLLQLSSKQVQTLNLIEEAIKQNNKKEVFRLLDLTPHLLGKKFIDEIDVELESNALYWAVYYRHVDFISRLTIEAIEGLDVNKMNNKNQTPVYIAVEKGHVAAIQILKAAGADVNARSFGMAPIWIAARHGHAAAVTALKIAGADSNAANIIDETPVYIAAKEGHTAAIIALKDAGANVNTPNMHGITPLYVAIKNGHTETVSYLLEAGADANINSKLSAALQEAKRKNEPKHKKIVRLLDMHYAAKDLKKEGSEQKLDRENVTIAELRVELEALRIITKQAERAHEAEAATARQAETQTLAIATQRAEAAERQTEEHRLARETAENLAREDELDREAATEARVQAENLVLSERAVATQRIEAAERLVARERNARERAEQAANETRIALAREEAFRLQAEQRNTELLAQQQLEVRRLREAEEQRTAQEVTERERLLAERQARELAEKEVAEHAHLLTAQQAAIDRGRIEQLEAALAASQLTVAQATQAREIETTAKWQAEQRAESAEHRLLERERIEAARRAGEAAASVNLRALQARELKYLPEFLKLVAEGEQDKAEAILKSSPNLALVAWDVTDLSKRTFTNITGFQYAVWALDWHMWTMIRKYLPFDEAQRQAQEFETGSWVGSHGIYANLNTLIQAYQTTIDLYNAGKQSEGDSAWVKQVGGAQFLLPAHVINEYCHPTRPLYPLPNFTDAAALPRTRALDAGEWFTTKVSGGKLGEKFAYFRWGYGTCFTSGGVVNSINRPDSGVESIRVLASTRTAQREQLIAELRPRGTQRLAA